MAEGSGAATVGDRRLRKKEKVKFELEPGEVKVISTGKGLLGFQMETLPLGLFGQRWMSSFAGPFCLGPGEHPVVSALYKQF